MILGLLAAFAALSAGDPTVAAQFKNGEDVVTPDDYPPGALSREISSFTVFETLVSPQGRTMRCQVTKSSGVDDFDDLTCMLMRKRARFKPALDDKGQPTIGYFKSFTIWMAGSNGSALNRLTAAFPAPDISDVVVTVESLPVGFSAPIKVKPAAVVDEQGRIAHCAPDPKGPPALAAVSCAQVMQLSPMKVITDDSGTPQRTVRELVVTFTTAEAQAKSPPPLPKGFRRLKK